MTNLPKPGLTTPKSRKTAEAQLAELAGVLDAAREALHNATLTTPEDAARTTCWAKGVDPTTGTGSHLYRRVAGQINSAYSAVEQGLDELARDLRKAAQEFAEAGVPTDATW